MQQNPDDITAAAALTDAILTEAHRIVASDKSNTIDIYQAIGFAHKIVLAALQEGVSIIEEARVKKAD